jgi:hypothetical protein
MTDKNSQQSMDLETLAGMVQRGFADTQTQIGEVQTKVSHLENEVSGLRGDVTDLRSDVSRVDERLRVVETTLAMLLSG